MKYMYYIGWSRRIDVPYHNTLGVAISEDGVNWEKLSDGPVMSSSILEPGYIGTVEIKKFGSIYRMWYLSCREWIEDFDRLEPIYDIKIAESTNGVDWKPTGLVAISLTEDEGGISSARFLERSGFFELYFSVRGKTGYRENTNEAYRIKKAVSLDGIIWERKNFIEIDTSNFGWDDFMTCYPEIVKTKNSTYMFYNGNGFGLSGIGYAELNGKQ
jgi:hypothetical protein